VIAPSLVEACSDRGEAEQFAMIPPASEVRLAAVVPLSVRLAAGGVFGYGTYSETPTVDRFAPVTSTGPLPPSMITVVTRLSIVNAVAAG
jgi:hypothetical protein